MSQHAYANGATQLHASDMNSAGPPLPPIVMLPITVEHAHVSRQRATCRWCSTSCTAGPPPRIEPSYWRGEVAAAAPFHLHCVQVKQPRPVRSLHPRSPPCRGRKWVYFCSPERTRMVCSCSPPARQPPCAMLVQCHRRFLISLHHYCRTRCFASNCDSPTAVPIRRRQPAAGLCLHYPPCSSTGPDHGASEEPSMKAA